MQNMTCTGRSPLQHVDAMHSVVNVHVLTRLVAGVHVPVPPGCLSPHGVLHAACSPVIHVAVPLSSRRPSAGAPASAAH